MSTKFEQLLDFIVNEEMDKANELFHEIVVEKSRSIYENLIAEEESEDETKEVDESMEDEDMDESMEDETKEVDESMEDEDMDESSEELEDSYMMDSDEEGDEHDFAAGDATDDLGADVMGDEENGAEGSEDQAIFDIKNAIADLEAAFAELEQAQGGEEDMGAEFGDEDGDEFGDEEPEDEMMGMHEGRRMTREYVEKVGNDWEKNSQKSQGQYIGANTGEGMPSPVEGKSPVSSGKGKPTTGATAKNILGDQKTGEGENTGTKPNGKTGGLTKNPTDMKTGNGNVPGGKMGVKNLTKVPGGHGAEKKGSGPGPVGSGTGDKAGQTSVGQVKSPLNGAPNRNA